MELLRDSDIDMTPLAGKRVAILGYGNQGRAQALNLKDSGVDVVVGLRGASGSASAAEEAGLEVALVEEAAASADLVMFLAPDEALGGIYKASRGPHPLRRRDRLQPWPGDPFRDRSSAPRPRRHSGRAEGSRDRAEVAVPARQGHGRAMGGGAGCDGRCADNGAGLWQGNRLRPRRAHCLQLRRGMRSRSLQRGRGRLGRSSRDPHRRLRHAGRGGHCTRGRVSGVRRRAEADRRV